MSLRFYEVEPSLENCWRGVILFGLNSASYKFALAKSLLELANKGSDFIRLEDLAEPFSLHIANHVKTQSMQSPRKSPVKFFDLCAQYNRQEIDKAKLVDYTVRKAFNDVIDRFHNVNNGEIPQRFFTDERGGTRKGIRLTDNLFKLRELEAASNLTPEVEARWRLVETAWGLNISSRLISVKHDIDTERFFVSHENRRVDVTSSRDALNGYQKSRCFHCFHYISVVSQSPFLADVDHFYPHALKQRGVDFNVDGVWNLVLACTNCNRMAEKGAKVPSLGLLERMNRRNEYLIDSNHPLKETLIQQTGKNGTERAAFLQAVHNRAKAERFHTWEPVAKADPTF